MTILLSSLKASSSDDSQAGEENDQDAEGGEIAQNKDERTHIPAAIVGSVGDGIAHDGFV